MGWDAWVVFALFWLIFVTSPGPNAVNCIQNGLTFGFRKSLWGVAAILTQATLFLTLSATGITALLVTMPKAYAAAKWIGAGFLIWLGIRAWLTAGTPPRTGAAQPRRIYLHALAVATINPKSVAGYFAAFTQFVDPSVPISQQMGVIVPTALSLTALSYCSYTALGAAFGKSALKTVFHLWVRRGLAACFVIYGTLLGLSPSPGLIR